MANMNLLQSNFSGKLGHVVGTRYKGQSVVKSKPIGKLPPKGLQGASVRAFECLNRVSAHIAKTLWVYLDLSEKKMLRHNAVAHWLKPLVQEHIFDIGALYSVIPDGSLCQCFSVVNNSTTKQTTMSFTNYNGGTIPAGALQYLMALDNKGRVYYSVLRPASLQQEIFAQELAPELTYSWVSFLIIPFNGKYIINNSSIKEELNMQKSLTEQLTGDLWLDGRPIYEKSFADMTTTVYPAGYSTTRWIPGTIPPQCLLVDTKYWTIDTANNYSHIDDKNFLIGSITASSATITGRIYVGYTLASGGLYVDRVIAAGSGSVTINGHILTVRYCKPA